MFAPRCCWLFVPVLFTMMAAMPAHEATVRAVPVLFGVEDAMLDFNSGDYERNRQLLEKWKADPEHYARLQRDLRAFWALPKEKHQRLRQLDMDLHQLDAKTQQSLWRAVERYSRWLERLPANERHEIETATDSQERLRRVKEIRERQWIERLPRKIRDELVKMPANERTVRVAQLREQERQQRKLWQHPLLGTGHRPTQSPARLGEFPKEVQIFVEKNLLPHLSAEEKTHYHRTEGRWPEFAQTLLELSGRHPMLPTLPSLPGQKSRAVTKYEELPVDAKVAAGPKQTWEMRATVWMKLKQVEGKWPEWALVLTQHLTEQQRRRMPPLGASRPEEFSSGVREFIDKRLVKVLTPKQRQGLRAAEGKWPDYPKTLLDLARMHKLQVPGMSLPGSAELWEAAANKSEIRNPKSEIQGRKSKTTEAIRESSLVLSNLDLEFLSDFGFY